MSVTRIPIRPPRVEPVLLSLLRERFPDVSFSSLRGRDNPTRECVLVADPQQRATPVTQYARVRVSVWVRRDDGTGDIAEAQRLAADIEHALTSTNPPAPLVGIDHESGPIRTTDDQGTLFAYLVLLATVIST